MVTNSNDNLLKLASLMIAEIESFFTSMQVGPRHPVSEFSFESGRNAFYVVYAGNGIPLKAGVLLASKPPQEKGRIFAEVEMLGRLGYATAYRLLDLGSELLAIEIGRILLDLFGATLPLSGAVWNDADIQSQSVAAQSQPVAAQPQGVPSLDGPRSAQETIQPAVTKIPEPVAAEPIVAEPKEEALPVAAVPVAPYVAPVAVVLTDADGMPIKRKRGRPRKEEVLARQALLAAQAQAESGLPVPVPGSGEAPPRRRRGRPRKSESIVPRIDASGVNGENPATPLPLVFENGTPATVSGVTPAGAQNLNGDGAAHREEARNGAQVEQTTNGSAHKAPEAASATPEEREEEPVNVPAVSKVLVMEDDEEEMPAFDFVPRALPLTKNQRREMRRRELDRIRRENGAS